MPSRRALLAGVGAVSAGLTGCIDLIGDVGDIVDGDSRQVPADWTPAPGEWAGPGYDQANSNHNPHASPPSTEPSVAWAVEVSPPSVVVADGTVFLREPESLRGLAADDGAERFEVSRPSGLSFRYIAGRLYDLTPNRYDPDVADDRLSRLHALTLDGEAIWDDSVRHTDQILSFVERERYVYVATGTKTIHHHDADTGERVDATVHDATVRDLANHDGVLYAALADGLVAYDVADDGSLEEQWRHRVDEESTLEPTRVAAGGGRIALVQFDRMVDESAVSLFDADGASFGTVEFDRSARWFAMGEEWYAASWISEGESRAGEVHAIDGTEARWSIELETGPMWLALADGTLYAGSALDGSSLTAVDAASGDELWRLDGVFPEAIVGETVYATTVDDRFVALRD